MVSLSGKLIINNNSNRCIVLITLYLLHFPGMHMHSVGLDEAHEMCINKESKTSITRPTKDNMERLVHFFPYRSKAIKNSVKDENE